MINNENISLGIGKDAAFAATEKHGQKTTIILWFRRDRSWLDVFGDGCIFCSLATSVSFARNSPTAVCVCIACTTRASPPKVVTTGAHPNFVIFSHITEAVAVLVDCVRCGVARWFSVSRAERNALVCCANFYLREHLKIFKHLEQRVERVLLTTTTRK